MVGIAFVVLVAGAGIAAYLVFGTRARKTADVLPTRVLSTQAVGLVVAGPAGAAGATSAPQMLTASSSDLSFARGGAGGAAWTSDQMAGGTYIFIYLQNGLCLAPKPVSSSASGTPAPARAVLLQRCNLLASQRWVRQDRTPGAGGLDYWQLRNLADGRCLTAGPDGSAAQLETCAASPGRQQLVAFVITP
jgi:hypothetical protein